MPKTVTENLFGIFKGRQVNKYTISNDSGLKVSIINYGATITNLFVADATGVADDIVLGFETLEGYINAPNMYMGSLCGRYANRIAKGKFIINGNAYQLTRNEGDNTLHGGNEGFDKVFWEASILPGGNIVSFSYCSKYGEEGFPGNLDVTVAYQLKAKALHIEYKATTDKATPVNLTSHCYFNLSAGADDDIFKHDLQLNADCFVEVDDKSIPTGKIEKTKDSEMDFTRVKNIDDAVKESGGFDHTWVLNNENELMKAATLLHKSSGRVMDVLTTYPGIHFYSGNFISETLSSTKKGRLYKKYGGLCLETQNFPDGPNKSHFPCTILQPGEVYAHTTIYNFSQTI